MQVSNYYNYIFISLGIDYYYISMAVGNNRSEISKSETAVWTMKFHRVKNLRSWRFTGQTIFHSVKDYRSAFWLADIECDACSQASVNMESDFANNFSTQRRERFKTISLIEEPRKIIKKPFVASLTWNIPYGCIFSKKKSNKLQEIIFWYFACVFAVCEYQIFGISTLIFTLI